MTNYEKLLIEAGEWGVEIKNLGCFDNIPNNEVRLIKCELWNQWCSANLISLPISWQWVEDKGLYINFKEYLYGDSDTINFIIKLMKIMDRFYIQ